MQPHLRGKLQRLVVDQFQSVGNRRIGKKPDVDIVVVLVKVIDQNVSFAQHDAVRHRLVKRDIDAGRSNAENAVNIVDHRHGIDVAEVRIGNIGLPFQVRQPESFRFFVIAEVKFKTGVLGVAAENAVPAPLPGIGGNIARPVGVKVVKFQLSDIRRQRQPQILFGIFKQIIFQPGNIETERYLLLPEIKVGVFDRYPVQTAVDLPFQHKRGNVIAGIGIAGVKQDETAPSFQLKLDFFQRGVHRFDQVAAVFQKFVEIDQRGNFAVDRQVDVVPVAAGAAVDICVDDVGRHQVGKVNLRRQPVVGRTITGFHTDADQLVAQFDRPADFGFDIGKVALKIVIEVGKFPFAAEVDLMELHLAVVDFYVVDITFRISPVRRIETLEKLLKRRHVIVYLLAADFRRPGFVPDAVIGENVNRRIVHFN